MRTMFWKSTILLLAISQGACKQKNLSPDLNAISPEKITARPLNDTAIIFPISYGNAKNYTIAINLQGSIGLYRHNTRSDIRRGPNQPYLEILGDRFVTGVGDRFDLPNVDFPHELLYLEDNDELGLGPLETVAGLLITRKVRIGGDDDVVRSLEIVHNPTPAPVTLSLRITSPTDGEHLLDETRDAQISTADRFFASYREGAGTIAMIVDGDGGDRIDEIENTVSETEFEWSDVTVQPGSTLIYAHFAYLSANNYPDQIRSKLNDLLTHPPWTGLTELEAQAIRNFTPEAYGNIVGQAGAAPAGELTVTNQNTGASLTITAAPDGSFSVALDAVAGNRIHLSHENGQDAVVVVREE